MKVSVTIKYDEHLLLENQKLYHKRIFVVHTSVFTFHVTNEPMTKSLLQKNQKVILHCKCDLKIVIFISTFLLLYLYTDTAINSSQNRICSISRKAQSLLKLLWTIDTILDKIKFIHRNSR